MRWQSSGVAVAVAVLLVSAFSPAVASASTAAPSIDWKPIGFALADGGTVEAETGVLRVPERRSVAGGNSVKLRLVRFASTAPVPGVPFVLLEGGPGLSGLAAARGRRFELIERLRAHGDVIVLDQRGVGRSRPELDCPQGTDVAPVTELTEGVWLEAVAEVSSRCAGSWERNGVDLAAYNVRESADDLEDLRRALGAEKISLWGQSYGTLVALVTIRRHPERVERAVLHGVLGPDDFVPLPKTTQKVVGALGRLAPREPGEPGLVESLRSVLESLEEAPVRQTIEDPRTGAPTEVRVGAFEARFGIHFIVLGSRDLMAMLPSWVAQMRRGDFSAIALMGLELRRWTPLALRMAAVCSTGISEKRTRKVEAQGKSAVLGRLPRLADLCPPWRVEPLGDGLLGPVEADVPVLLVSGTLDSVTPPKNAKAVARGFRRAQRLTLVRGTHSDLVHGDPRILDAIDDFLAGRPQAIRRIVLPEWEFPGAG